MCDDFFETDFKYIHSTSLFIVLDFRNITDISLQFPVPDDLDFFNDGFYQPWLIIVHGEYELTDTLPLFKVEDYFHDRREYGVRTRHFSKSNTRSQPCKRYKPNACLDYNLQKKMLTKYGCQASIFYSGPHLHELEINGINLSRFPMCNKTVILEMASIPDDSFNCRNSIPCEFTDYSIEGVILVHGPDSDSYSTLKMSFNQQEEQHISSISLDTQGLIGNVGGILGITLGMSAITLLEFMEPILRRLSNFIIPL